MELHHCPTDTDSSIVINLFRSTPLGFVPNTQNLAVFVSDPSITEEQRKLRQVASYNMMTSSQELAAHPGLVLDSLAKGPRIITQRKEAVGILVPINERHLPRADEITKGDEPREVFDGSPKHAGNPVALEAGRDLVILDKQLRRPGQVIKGLTDAPRVIMRGDDPVALFVGLDSGLYTQVLLQGILGISGVSLYDAMLPRPRGKHTRTSQSLDMNR